MRRSRDEMYIDQDRLCVCLCVCLSALAAFSHYCTDPDVGRGNSRVCPLVVHCWADLDGFRCYDNIETNAKCQRVLVIALYCTWLVLASLTDEQKLTDSSLYCVSAR